MPLPNSLQTNYLNEAVANAQSQLQVGITSIFLLFFIDI